MTDAFIEEELGRLNHTAWPVMRPYLLALALDHRVERFRMNLSARAPDQMPEGPDGQPGADGRSIVSDQISEGVNGRPRKGRPSSCASVPLLYPTIYFLVLRLHIMILGCPQ